MDSLYLFIHQKEWPLYQYLEDQFNCSGICRPGLFYFHNPITYGPPTETCLKHFVELIKEKAQPVAVLMLLQGVLGVILTILHFGLYNRPQDS